MAIRCGVVGIGQTKYDAKRIDVSMPGLVREAALIRVTPRWIRWSFRRSIGSPSGQRS